jgi:N-methylhydantoinase A
VLEPLTVESLAAAEESMAAMLAEIREEFGTEVADLSALEEERQFDLRYRGQAHELTVIAPALATLPEVLERFEAAFERQFGRRDSGRGVELVNLRVIGRVPIETPAWTPPGGGTGQRSGTRSLPDLTVPCDVWSRADILPGMCITGPAVIEEMSATTWLPRHWSLSLGLIGQMELCRIRR